MLLWYQSFYGLCFHSMILLIAHFLINRMSSRALKFQTPLSVLKSCFPIARIFSELDLRVFGCFVYVHLHDVNHSKLDPGSCKCVFLDYSTLQKGYKCYSFEKQKYFISTYVSILENQFYFPTNQPQGEIF